MEADRTVIQLLSVLLLLATVAPAVALPPQVGAAGPDGSCRTCHTPSEGNAASALGASISIEGVPLKFVPGTRYNVTVVIARGLGPQPTYAILHAFQLWVSNGSLEAAGDDTVQVADREVGSRGATRATRWSVLWTAPHSNVSVAFEAEGVVANGDGTPEGDVRLGTTVVSYAPLDVPPDESPGPWPGRWAVGLLMVAIVALVGYGLAFTHRRPPPMTVE